MTDIYQNNENIKNKECVICKNIINNDKLDKSLKEIIVEYINKGFKHEEIVIFYNKIKDRYTDELILSSPYYLKLHQQECLGLDLKELREKRKFNNKLSVESNYKTVKNNLDNMDEKVIEEKNISFQEHINMLNILEDYRNKSFQERETDYLRMLREVDYMSLVSIHHQLLHGKVNKNVVPKEDIGSLKNIQDILQVLTANIFDDEEIPEININVINTEVTNENILKDYDFPISKNPSLDHINNENENKNENDINLENDIVDKEENKNGVSFERPYGIVEPIEID